MMMMRVRADDNVNKDDEDVDDDANYGDNNAEDDDWALIGEVLACSS